MQSPNSMCSYSNKPFSFEKLVILLSVFAKVIGQNLELSSRLVKHLALSNETSFCWTWRECWEVSYFILIGLFSLTSSHPSCSPTRQNVVHQLLRGWACMFDVLVLHGLKFIFSQCADKKRWFFETISCEGADNLARLGFLMTKFFVFNSPSTSYCQNEERSRMESLDILSSANMKLVVYKKAYDTRRADA